MSSVKHTYLFDTSALLALMEDEEGAARVERILEREHVLIPFVALLEVYYTTQRKRGQPTAEKRYAMLKQIPHATILWGLDEPTLLTAARIKAVHRLSFADAVVAAFAARNNAILVHKDPEFQPLSNDLTLETLPYK